MAVEPGEGDRWLCDLLHPPTEPVEDEPVEPEPKTPRAPGGMRGVVSPVLTAEQELRQHRGEPSPGRVVAVADELARRAPANRSSC
jgi:hypothetical protein